MNNQRPLFTHDKLPLPNPPANRSDTSQAAAKKVATKTVRARQQILDYLGHCGDRGATDHEMQTDLAMRGSFQRPRRWELADDHDKGMGLITRNGEKRNGGRVWVRC